GKIEEESSFNGILAARGGLSLSIRAPGQRQKHQPEQQGDSQAAPEVAPDREIRHHCAVPITISTLPLRRIPAVSSCGRKLSRAGMLLPIPLRLSVRVSLAGAE